MDGFLVLDKPRGWTSFDVVNYVRAIAARVESKKPRHVKVGHIGTLDPAATGLLVLCVGKYTKKVPELIRHDKTYEAEITFGATSSTGDGEGEIEGFATPGIRNNSKGVREAADARTPGKEQVEEVLRRFVGEIEQVPPKYSALKVNGQRAYKLARAGKEVTLAPRLITVHSLDLLDYKWPVAHVVCRVGSGTYIRSLAEDIGKDLRVGAYLSGLRRTKIDTWAVAESTGPKSITIDNIGDKLLA